ncbi:hypothetical protein BD289DRAFT_456193 [Coniella lustricola]|uniref:DUF7820 domain-containing protein n=1 Tax=Coniella lustricola TaxID=2025994 RepID=A0A2T2ZWW6_9PEZI|nr:hypothetical protein BD289DRAFT_456193 [Coniella lustricola]
MGDRSSKSSNPERRSSIRSPRRISVQQDGHVNVENESLSHPGEDETDVNDQNDEYMLALAGMISDGFRPGPATAPSPAETVPAVPTAAIGPQSNVRFEPASPPRASPDTISSSPIFRPHRSSISKPPPGRDSFTLRHDGAEGHLSGAALSRVSSTSSEAAYVPVETPYQGPSGPSHPYQMYSQDTRLSRTLSNASASTAPTSRPDSDYQGPRGPSHPYSMYPQNPIEEETQEPVVPTIPVGFVSAADPYQRRLGPEGEELADIIGPDGHTEELPPYTRYPDEYYTRKIRDNDESQRNSAEATGEGSTAAAGAITAGAVVVAAAAATDVSSLNNITNPTTTTMAAISSSGRTTPTSASPIPGAGGIGLAARNPEYDSGSLDGSRGLAGSRHSSRSFGTESHHEVNTAAAELSEKPQLTRYQRFAKRKACGVIPYWALGLTFTALLIVFVIIGALVGTLLSHRKQPSNSSSGPTNYQDSVPTVTVTYDATPIPTPTNLPALAQGSFGLPLNLNQEPNTCFNDTSQSSAWSCNIIFQQAISMQVLVTQNAPQLGTEGFYNVLLTNNATDSNDSGNMGLSYGASAPTITPAMELQLVNDTFDLSRGPAWFRMLPYNKTVVVQENMFSSGNTRRSSGMIPTVDQFQRKGVAEVGDRPWICTWPDTFVEMFIYAEQNSSYAYQSTATITTAPTTATATATGGSTATSTADTEIINMAHLTAYPRAIKVKERRVASSMKPYCEQVEVLANNSTQPVRDSNGNPIIVMIEEIETQNGMSRRDGEEWSLERRADGGDMSSCGCMWFSS